MVHRPGDIPPDWVWGTVLAVGVGYELYALRRELVDHTFTRRTRHHFRTHHPAGKVAFIVGWTALWAWYLKHIIEGEN